jgi:flagellar assembly protein FliH
VAKNVFRSTEVVNLGDRVLIHVPPHKNADRDRHHQLSPQPAVIRKEELYTGPTVEELRREAEAFKAEFEKQKEEMLATARAEADSIVKEAEARAFEEVKRGTEEAERLRAEAEAETERVLEEARKSAEAQAAEAAARVEETGRQAYQEGFARGREEGYGSGREEVERLVERLHVILSKAIEKRAEIIQDSEVQLVNLVLLIAKKVIKVISENQKAVVVNNVIQALRKLKTRTDVVLRVNTADLKLTSAHVKDFIRLVENAKTITVMEDTTVDRGGCIVETDFGLIDARISSQLSEIEDRILELMPIRTTAAADRNEAGS